MSKKEDNKNKCNPGETHEITSLDPTIKRIAVSIGWDMVKLSDDGIDVDLSAFLLNKKEVTRVDEDFIFYNQEAAEEDSVLYLGDNRSGIGDGDDEIIHVVPKTIPYEVSKIMFVLSIYQAYEKEHNFSMVKRAYLRISNPDEDREYLVK